MRLNRDVLLTVLLFAFVGPAAGAQGSVVPDSLVLERTRCFGICPAYRLRIARDGAVAFESRNPGDATRANVMVAPQTLERLFTADMATAFFSLPSRITSDKTLCVSIATDHPSLTISVFGGTTHSVDYYTGCYAPTGGDPAQALTRHPRLVQLGAFASAIDSVLGSSRWVRPAGRP